MMRIGLTGGIGSGKSTVARALAGHGASIIDADAIARDVLARDTPGLAAVRQAFGEQVVAGDGSLDRAALATVVFGDPQRLRVLEGITHPLIWAEADRQFAAVPAGGIAVHDMPLLVEKAMAAQYHLVVVVMLDARTRVRRLVEHRGLDAQDARRRIEAQAGDAERIRAADVLLDNAGTPEDLTLAAEHLWRDRIAPFAANLLAGRAAGRDARSDALAASLAAAGVIGQRDRITARVCRALGSELVFPDSGEAAPGTRAGEVEVSVHLRELPSETVRDRLREAGFPPMTGQAGQDAGDRMVLGNADPAWPARIALSAPDAAPQSS